MKEISRAIRQGYRAYEKTNGVIRNANIGYRKGSYLYIRFMAGWRLAKLHERFPFLKPIEI